MERLVFHITPSANNTRNLSCKKNCNKKHSKNWNLTFQIQECDIYNLQFKAWSDINVQSMMRILFNKCYFIYTLL